VKSKLYIGSTLVAVSALVAACGSSSSSDSSSAVADTATEAAASSGAAASSAAPVDDKFAEGKVIILDTLYRAPLAQNEAAGAMAAAEETGASINWVGPTNIDPPAAIKAFQDAAAAGADGAIVAAFPGDLFKVPIDQADMPVVTIQLSSPGSAAKLHLATDKYELGASLAKEFAAALPPDSKGEVIAGICVPGLPALVAPQQGFIDTMKELQPGVTVIGDNAVDGDATKNYVSWQRIIQQNPDALGFVGQCDQDVPNLIKLKRDSGAPWLIGATSGDSAENIAAVKDGTMVSIIGQNGWLEGYLATRLLLEQIVNGTPMPEGFIDLGHTVITPENADAVTARVQDPTLNATDFKEFIDKVLADPAAMAQPLDACRGCGTTFTP
jgi:ABC-type sugar transport system substrate-binding protein